MTSHWHDDEYVPGCDCDEGTPLAGIHYRSSLEPDDGPATPPPSAAVPDPADVEKAAPQDELREQLGRWLFERDYGGATTLCSPQDAGWHEWVERNREEWREEADALLAALAAVRPSPDSEAVARVEAVIDGMVHELHLAKSDYVNEWQRCDALARSIDQLRAALGTGDREGTDRG